MNEKDRKKVRKIIEKHCFNTAQYVANAITTDIKLSSGIDENFRQEMEKQLIVFGLTLIQILLEGEEIVLKK